MRARYFDNGTPSYVLPLASLYARNHEGQYCHYAISPRLLVDRPLFSQQEMLCLQLINAADPTRLYTSQTLSHTHTPQRLTGYDGNYCKTYDTKQAKTDYKPAIDTLWQNIQHHLSTDENMNTFAAFLEKHAKGALIPKFDARSTASIPQFDGQPSTPPATTSNGDSRSFKF